MNINISLKDIDSFTREEAVERVKSKLGHSIEVSVYPDSDDPIDILRFALQQIVGYDQLCLLMDSPYEYKDKISILQQNILKLVARELSSIILVNEIKHGE